MEQPELLHVSPQNPDCKNQTSAMQIQKQIMGRLKDTIFTTLSASIPSKTVTQEVKSHIEKQLHGFFPHFRTPTHPPYALMIRTAIMELNEDTGSSEESISEFIKKEYEDLPWAHPAFLSHHLRKLCETGEIVRRNDGQYTIVVDQVDVKDKKEMGQRINTRQNMLHACHVGDKLQNELKEVEKETRVIEQKIEEGCPAEGQEIAMKEKQIVVFEEKHASAKQEVEHRREASRQDIEATVQLQERPTAQLNDGEQYYPQNQLLAVTKENPLQVRFEDQMMENLRLCYFSIDGVGKNSLVGESPLLAVKEDQKEYLKQECQQLKTNSFRGEWKFSIVCGLPAQRQLNDQQKAPKLQPDNKQKQQSRSQGRRSHSRCKLDADTSMRFLQSEHQHDIKKKQYHQVEGEGRPPKPEGNGDYQGSLRFYIRRRHKP